jgi:AraC-like DNA-binding protein
VKKADAGKFDFELPDGGKIARRTTGFLPDGAYFFQDDLDSSGVFSAKIVTGAGWLLEIVELEAGEIFFVCGGREIRPDSNRIGIFYAPFSILQTGYKDARGRVRGIAATRSLPEEISARPFVFEMTGAQNPSSADEAIEILASRRRRRQSIEFNPKASLLSVKAKRLIDENYLIFPSIARVAARLGVSHEHLARQFKRDFGLTPSSYLRQIRIADAPLRLAKGEEIISVSQQVGYNDLSRFYKQFRQTNETSPGACQTLLKPAEK